MTRPTDAPGWPRRWLRWKGRTIIPQGEHRLPGLKPSPWINGDGPEKANDWLCFPADRSFSAYYHGACVVCGEPCEGAYVMGAYGGFWQDKGKETAGPGGHPRCLYLAVTTCPHLLEIDADKPVAYVYDGFRNSHTCRQAEVGEDEPYSDGVQEVNQDAVPLTRDELKALARRDPDGTRSTVDLDHGVVALPA
jgi:hypothetical protein